VSATIGPRNGWGYPPCQVHGCKGYAHTFGAMPGGRIGNICDYHASRQGNVKVRRQKRRGGK
jgi:hypothetical protein